MDAGFFAAGFDSVPMSFNGVSALIIPNSLSFRTPIIPVRKSSEKSTGALVSSNVEILPALSLRKNEPTDDEAYSTLLRVYPQSFPRKESFKRC